MLEMTMNTTLNKEERIPLQLTIREPGSAITHLIGMVLAILGAIPLLVKAAVQGGPESFIASSVFIISMILLYGASATYHSVNLAGDALKVFKRMDHLRRSPEGLQAHGPHDDLRPDRGLLYTDLHADPSPAFRPSHALRRLGNRASWHAL